MLTGRTIRTSLVILAATVAAATQAQAHPSNCTPPHLVNALRQIEAQCGRAKIVSDYRPGAVIRGTRHASQHSFCNGKNGAIDAEFSNRACALSALRKTNYTILTYRKSSHIHIGTDGWSRGGSAHAAHRRPTRVRAASRLRAGARSAQRARGDVRVAHKQWPRVGGRANDSNWSSEW
jgi:hypothetical protein